MSVEQEYIICAKWGSSFHDVILDLWRAAWKSNGAEPVFLTTISVSRESAVRVVVKRASNGLSHMFLEYSDGANFKVTELVGEKARA